MARTSALVKFVALSLITVQRGGATQTSRLRALAFAAPSQEVVNNNTTSAKTEPSLGLASDGTQDGNQISWAQALAKIYSTSDAGANLDGKLAPTTGAARTPPTGSPASLAARTPASETAPLASSTGTGAVSGAVKSFTRLSVDARNSAAMKTMASGTHVPKRVDVDSTVTLQAEKPPVPSAIKKMDTRGGNNTSFRAPAEYPSANITRGASHPTSPPKLQAESKVAGAPPNTEELKANHSVAVGQSIFKVAQTAMTKQTASPTRGTATSGANAPATAPTVAPAGDKNATSAQVNLKDAASLAAAALAAPGTSNVAAGEVMVRSSILGSSRPSAPLAEHVFGSMGIDAQSWEKNPSSVATPHVSTTANPHALESAPRRTPAATTAPASEAQGSVMANAPLKLSSSTHLHVNGAEAVPTTPAPKLGKQSGHQTGTLSAEALPAKDAHSNTLVTPDMPTSRRANSSKESLGLPPLGALSPAKPDPLAEPTARPPTQSQRAASLPPGANMSSSEGMRKVSTNAHASSSISKLPGGEQPKALEHLSSEKASAATSAMKNGTTVEKAMHVAASGSVRSTPSENHVALREPAGVLHSSSDATGAGPNHTTAIASTTIALKPSVVGPIATGPRSQENKGVVNAQTPESITAASSTGLPPASRATNADVVAHVANAMPVAAASRAQTLQTTPTLARRTLAHANVDSRGENIQPTMTHPTVPLPIATDTKGSVLRVSAPVPRKAEPIVHASTAVTQQPVGRFAVDAKAAGVGVKSMNLGPEDVVAEPPMSGAMEREFKEAPVASSLAGAADTAASIAKEVGETIAVPASTAVASKFREVAVATPSARVPTASAGTGHTAAQMLVPSTNKFAPAAARPTTATQEPVSSVVTAAPATAALGKGLPATPAPSAGDAASPGAHKSAASAKVRQGPVPPISATANNSFPVAHMEVALPSSASAAEGAQGTQRARNMVAGARLPLESTDVRETEVVQHALARAIAVDMPEAAAAPSVVGVSADMRITASKAALEKPMAPTGTPGKTNKPQALPGDPPRAHPEMKATDLEVVAGARTAEIGHSLGAPSANSGKQTTTSRLPDIGIDSKKSKVANLSPTPADAAVVGKAEAPQAALDEPSLSKFLRRPSSVPYAGPRILPQKVVIAEGSHNATAPPGLQAPVGRAALTRQLRAYLYGENGALDGNRSSSEGDADQQKPFRLSDECKEACDECKIQKAPANSTSKALGRDHYCCYHYFVNHKCTASHHLAPKPGSYPCPGEKDYENCEDGRW